MAGHSHWAGIKRRKEAQDQKRGKVFAKLLAAVTAAARGEPNPEFNPRLRTAIEKARAAQIPQDTIERAVKRASEAGSGVEEILCEAYGPGGAAILIEAITDNKNRTIAEVKKILSEHGAKWADAGSVRWIFSQTADSRVSKLPTEVDRHGLVEPPIFAHDKRWGAQFLRKLGVEDRKKLSALVAALESRDDIQEVYTNAQLT